MSYPGEDTADQLGLIRSVFQVIRMVREKHACRQCDATYDLICKVTRWISLISLAIGALLLIMSVMGGY
ncbi:IS66 family transposase zinc-finger binding domain-containing protein [Serratia fonticola]|uniref:IS66 family transposase zinc-finger binding domain-containing protein n=1 Tax=Serratia fonticola TaxID=47917 RepID=UPI0009BF3D51